MKDYTKLAASADKGIPEKFNQSSIQPIEEQVDTPKVDQEQTPTATASTENPAKEKLGFFDKIADSISEAFKSGRNHFDPAGFQDPIATKTDWNPLKRGGSNFCSHRLAIIDANQADFKATKGTFIFGGIFMVMGTLIPGGIMLAGFSDSGFKIALLFPLFFMFIFVGIGFAMIKSFSRPITFNKTTNTYRKGNINKPKELTSLDEIHAIQLIREYIRTDKSSYYSYELNLVTKNAGRINVVDHGSLSKLRQDAEQLAQFLNVPVWDAC